MKDEELNKIVEILIISIGKERIQYFDYEEIWCIAETISGKFEELKAE